MRILVIAHYQNDSSPTASFIHSQLKAIKQLGHEVLVIVPIALGKSNYHKQRLSAPIQREIIENVDYIFVRYLSLSSYGEECFNTGSAIYAMAGRVLREIKQFDPDIIHAHTIGFDSEIGKWIKGKIGKQLVVTIHGSDLDIPMRAGNRLAVKRKLEGVDRVVTISKKLQRNVETLYPSNKVCTILNGCNVEKCCLGEKQKHSILFAGNLIEQKNADVVIKAFADIKKIYDDSRLVIIGKGPKENELRSLCERLSVNHEVEFTGQIPNELVLKRMSISEYFIMPSINEGFGIVYIEAMACGCITIGTKKEGISDFIEHNINGFLVEANERAIVEEFRKCENNDALKKRIRKNAIIDARGLSWERNAKANIKLYEE